MPSSRIVTDTPKPGVVKTKSKGSCVNRSTYLSHLSNLSSNSKTEVLTSDSQVPSTFHHHVQVVTSDEVRIMVMKMIMAMEMVMRQKNDFDFGPVQVPHVLPHWVVHLRPWLKEKYQFKKGFVRVFFYSQRFFSRGAESHFSKSHIFVGLLRQRPLSNQD